MENAPSPEMRPPETRPGLGVLLHEASRAIRKTFERRVGPEGLSSAQWRLLLVLSKSPAGTSQARLADLMEVEPISISRLVDRMEASGWVERQSDPSDRRAKIVTPTDKARAAHAQIRAIADGIYAEAMAGLPPDHRQVLIESLTALIANLNEAAPRCAAAPAATAQGAEPK